MMDEPQQTVQDAAPIFLVGFMGAGKTTVGRVLARRLKYDLFDLDQLIEARAGKTISEIFAERGEPEFRRLEREAIRSYSELKHAVIALGGGAYVSEENRRVLRAAGKTVWLDCPLEVCLRRIGADKTRPLAGDPDQMAELLEARRAAYAKADYVLTTAELTAEEIAVEIINMLSVTTT